MSQNGESLYVGQAKEIIRDGREPYIRLELDLTELKAKIQEAHIRKWSSQKSGEHRTIALIVAPMNPENRTEYKTHSVKIDTWKPDPSKARTQTRNEPEPTRQEYNDDAADIGEDVPF